MYSVTVDEMYLVQAMTLQIPGLRIPPDFLQQAYEWHKWITVTLMLSWSAIHAVKFSFLFLFRRLIDRIRLLVVYWWFVVALNVVSLGYGLVIYYITCPYFSTAEICELPPVVGSPIFLTSGKFPVSRHRVLLGSFAIRWRPISWTSWVIY